MTRFVTSLVGALLVLSSTTSTDAAVRVVETSSLSRQRSAAGPRHRTLVEGRIPIHANAYPDTFGLSQPLDPGNPQALGAYRLWFYERDGYPKQDVTDNIACYEGSC